MGTYDWLRLTKLLADQILVYELLDVIGDLGPKDCVLCP